MKTRAAIAWAAGKPLEVVDVDLDGPQEREPAGGGEFGDGGGALRHSAPG